MNGTLHSGPARANDSFGTANTILYYNATHDWVEWRLNAGGKGGFYEGFVNYTPPINNYWTTFKAVQLAPETRSRCRAFYGSPLSEAPRKTGQCSKKLPPKPPTTPTIKKQPQKLQLPPWGPSKGGNPGKAPVS